MIWPFSLFERKEKVDPDLAVIEAKTRAQELERLRRATELKVAELQEQAKKELKLNNLARAKAILQEKQIYVRREHLITAQHLAMLTAAENIVQFLLLKDQTAALKAANDVTAQLRREIPPEDLAEQIQQLKKDQEAVEQLSVMAAGAADMDVTNDLELLALELAAEVPSAPQQIIQKNVVQTKLQ